MKIDIRPKRKLDSSPRRQPSRFCSLWRTKNGTDTAIWARVEEATEASIRLGPETLYSSVRALLEERLLEEVEVREDTGPGRNRRR